MRKETHGGGTGLTAPSKSLALALVILFMLILVCPLPAQAASSGANIDLADNSPPAAGDGWTYVPGLPGIYTVTGDVEISGTNNDRLIIVAGGAKVSITLNNAIINRSTTADTTSPLVIEPGAVVNLLLENSNTLKGGNSRGVGVNVKPGAELTIGGTGSLEATGGVDGAGIGGSPGEGVGTININSGTINATGGNPGATGIGYSNDNMSGVGVVTINGGTVNANGIAGSIITITGGTVTTTGSYTGIDGSEAVTITGGKVIATGYNSAGIACFAGRTVTITGGDVEARGSNEAAGIGGGSNKTNNANYGNISILGGTVQAFGGLYAAGIGGGVGGSGGNIVISNATVTATGGTNASNMGGGGGAGIGSGGSSSMKSGSSGNITIVNGANVTATGGDNINGGGGGGAGIGTGGCLADFITPGSVNAIVIEPGTTINATSGLGNGSAGYSWPGAPSGIGHGGMMTPSGADVMPATTFLTHTLTASAGTGGSISPSGPVTVVNHANRPFTITANEGYIISEVTVGGASKPIHNINKFTLTVPDVTGDSNIAVAFIPIPALEGDVAFSVNAATGAVTAAATGGNTGAAGMLIYKWSGGAAGTGATATPTLGYSATCTVTATGATGSISASVTVYKVVAALSGNVSGDTAYITDAYGKIGDVISIAYTIAQTGTAANSVAFTGGAVADGGTSSATYTIVAADSAAGGIITITANFSHTNKIAVTNTGGAESVTYSGATFDLSALASLFTIDANAGARTYNIEGGTGEGSVGADNKTLTAEKAGTLTIGLITAETGTHQAGAKVTATLTVNKGTQSAPAGFGKTDVTSIGGNDGTITGLAAGMNYEYSKDGGGYTATTSSASGEITDLAAGSYVVRLPETDLYNASADSGAVIIGQPTALTFTDSSAYDIPASTVGTAITDIDVSGGVSGGIPSYTFSATGLPAGISISAAGIISGTPTTSGAAGTVVITVTDSATPTPGKESITINYGAITEQPAPPVSVAPKIGGLQSGKDTIDLTEGYADYTKSYIITGTPAPALNVTGITGASVTDAGALTIPAGLKVGNHTATITVNNSVSPNAVMTVTVKVHTRDPKFTTVPPPITHALADAVFVINGNYKDLAGISINGVSHPLNAVSNGAKTMLLNPKDSNDVRGHAVSGSVIITIYKEYHSTLPNGIHKVSTWFRGENDTEPYATAETTFEIRRQTDGSISSQTGGNGVNSHTGDNSNMEIWWIAILGSLFGMISILLRIRWRLLKGTK